MPHPEKLDKVNIIIIIIIIIKLPQREETTPRGLPWEWDLSGWFGRLSHLLVCPTVETAGDRRGARR